MQVKQWMALGAVAFAAGTVMAAETPLTRAQVAQSVIASRAAGQLRPTGDAADYQPSVSVVASTVTRDQVRRETLAARAAVKAETLRARADGELVPAGEGIDGVNSVHTARVAPRKANPLARLFHAGTPAGQ